MSVFGVILVRIFPHLDWIRRDMEYLSVFSPNAVSYGHFSQSGLLLGSIFHLHTYIEMSQFCVEIVHNDHFSGQSQKYRCLVRQLWSISVYCYPANIYLFEVNIKNTRKRYEICYNLIIKILEQRLVLEFLFNKVEGLRASWYYFSDFFTRVLI